MRSAARPSIFITCVIWPFRPVYTDAAWGCASIADSAEYVVLRTAPRRWPELGEEAGFEVFRRFDFIVVPVGFDATSLPAKSPDSSKCDSVTGSFPRCTPASFVLNGSPCRPGAGAMPVMARLDGGQRHVLTPTRPVDGVRCIRPVRRAFRVSHVHRRTVPAGEAPSSPPFRRRPDLRRVTRANRNGGCAGYSRGAVWISFLRLDGQPPSTAWPLAKSGLDAICP